MTSEGVMSDGGQVCVCVAVRSPLIRRRRRKRGVTLTWRGERREEDRSTEGEKGGMKAERKEDE